MLSATVEPPWDEAAWRDIARRALGAEVRPEEISWSDSADASLFTGALVAALPMPAKGPGVPAEFLSLAGAVLANRDPHRHALLYRLLWRITHGERHLLGNPLDPDVYRARTLEKTIRRDLHKMKAFVRFRAVPGSPDNFVAWFEPEHYIVDLAVPFFVRRFAGMRWAILTPYRSAAWDGESLLLGEGATKEEAPAEDASEALWQTYYANIFNPARLNPRMMRQEMPQKYWKMLPETRQIPSLIRDAGARVRDMADREAQAAAKPRIVARALAATTQAPAQGLKVDIGSLREQAKTCRACSLWRQATQTVFGEGLETARVLVVGDQPGDQEDLRGRPFIGPAGLLLDRALSELGLDRSQWYVTNAVKHFKFERDSKVRLHSKASAVEQQACRHWLDAEILAVNPGVILCLGATAATAVLGQASQPMRERGHWQRLSPSRRVLVTVHPSWILQHKSDRVRETAYQGFVADLSLLVEEDRK